MFRRPSWIKVQILLAGSILLTGRRTVTQALRVTGRSTDERFALYHHVLNRAVWSPLRAAQRLLLMLLKFLDDGKQPLVFGIDETIERRWGAKIKARGIYRDAVRSSSSHICQNQRTTLDSADVANTDSLGIMHLGAAVFDDTGTL